MTETQQRFLRAITERVPVDQVVELHLFPSIRQGGVETGVAVVAEDPRRSAADGGNGPDAPDAPDGESVPASATIAAATIEAPDGLEAPAAAAGDAEAASDDPGLREEPTDPPADMERSPIQLAGDIDGDVSPAVAEAAGPQHGEHETFGAADSPDAPAESADAGDAWAADVGDAWATDASGADAEPTPARTRYTIHTARYRLTLKGVDRGKWEVDVVAEADAPLDALDAVVRGVQRRAGEGADPDRLSAVALREALAAPLATLER